MKNVTVEIKNDIVLFICTGPYSKEFIVELMLYVKKSLDENKMKKALVDGRAITGNIPDFERFELGKLFAVNLSRFRIGMLMEPKKINKLAENTAVNRGGDILISADMDAILKWLKR
ncbi:MAG: hypothetical protein ABSA34_00840 [Candidatus Goldiibacteriota bacterium]|jgi:hypothetical protein